MKKYIYKVVLLLLLFICIDSGYGYVMNTLRLKAQGGFTAKNRYVCDSARQDILIFGSSRGRMQYDPQIISDSLNMSCYNCGNNGMGIIFNYARMKIISKRYMPKMVICDILPILDMMTRDDNIIFLNDLRPWYDVDGVDSVFWKVDYTERYKMFSKMYSFHSKFLEYWGDRNAVLPKYGYDPAPATQIISDAELHQKEPQNNVPDSLKLYFMEKFIKEYGNKTKLIFVVSPRYNFKTSNTVRPLKKLCIKYHVVLFDHYADSKYVFHRRYFEDGNHMNVTGATIFSRDIAHEIKNEMNRQK